MNKNGFTLTELMVTLALFAIISAMAAPAFSHLLKQQEVDGQTDALVAMIYLARSEAIKRNQVVTVCKSTNQETCGGNWSDGWLMFADSNSDGERQLSETAIKSDLIVDGYQLVWSAFYSDNYIRFKQNGLTKSHNGSFTLCPENGDERLATAVIVSKTGRVRHSQDNNHNGIDEAANGNDLSCK